MGYLADQELRVSSMSWASCLANYDNTHYTKYTYNTYMDDFDIE